MKQTPAAGQHLLKWVGDTLEIKVTNIAKTLGQGKMFFRTNIGAVAIHQAEVLAHVDENRLISGDDWHDIPMRPCGKNTWAVRIPLLEVGIFEGKACFIRDDDPEPIWVGGEGNTVVKVAPAHTAAGNMIYAAFVRQFAEGTMFTSQAPTTLAKTEATLDEAGYTVIPPSGTFRALIRHLDHICVDLGFRNLLLLPIHPTPTTFARMGRFGSPFAGRDFLDIDPALAEFDTTATPLDQFHELVAAVHARGAALFMDLPANHTGWAATFQIHHPEWYRKNADGSFHSPGAWGVTWEDLVELDYSKPELRRAIADVFLYWCRQGVDGFRCDAGYMIPKAAWDVIVALVRREYPDTVFLLEGLGGPMETTEALIGNSGLDWAYSEMFQTYDRSAFEAMLPEMLRLSEGRGPLVHFAETHDNNRLAATSPTYARLRIALSALLSQQGAFGITAGVEWYAREKIDVHGCGGLNWGAEDNACALIHRLNTLLRIHPLFGEETALEQLQYGGGNVLAILRKRPDHAPLLILANLDCQTCQTVTYRTSAFPVQVAYDLVSGHAVSLNADGIQLAPGQVCCLSTLAGDLTTLEAALRQRGVSTICAMDLRLRRVMAMRTLNWLDEAIPLNEPDHALATRFIQDPVAFTKTPAGLPRAITLHLPTDFNRDVMVPPGKLLYITAPSPFRARLHKADGEIVCEGRAIAMADGSYGLMLPVHRTYSPIQVQPRRTEQLSFTAEMYTPQGVSIRTSSIFALAEGIHAGLMRRRFSGLEVKNLDSARLLLTNGTGAMSQIRLKWGDIRSQYDCLLALNRHATVPDDRQIFFTRCRAWILCNGYSTPLAGPCLEHVTVAPDGSAAEWRFAAPCGMGRRVPITLRVALEPGSNRVVLRFRRDKAAKPWRDPEMSVGLVLRPDIEWRNFHRKTKAYTGPEAEWQKAVKHFANGFAFRPEANTELTLSMPKAEWNPESKWTYNVYHPEEAARGQDANTDLWSPGWFHIELNRGDEAVLTAGEPSIRTPKIPAMARVLPSAPLSLCEGMKLAIRNYIVRRDAHKTVIAGYPWFLDWGRDTLIFLRGVAAAGDWETVFDTLTEFGRFEKGGTIPNMIRGEDDANRETVDAPLWFAVVVDDAIAVHGAEKVLSHPCGKSRTLRDVLVSIAENYIKGTVNGIKADLESGLIWAPHHYTWMDTNYPAGTPRNGYSVEIQALWVRLLDLLGREVAPKWKRLASKVRTNFVRYFPLPEGGLSDCLYAEQGVSAKDADPDDAVRPNQLYAVTLGLLQNHRELAASVLHVTECLLSPGAIRTLADRPVRRPLPIYRDGVLLNNPNHPYWGRYEGDEDTRRKPAYHNGTGWTLQFPLYAEALFLTYGADAYRAAKALLASSEFLVNKDCITQLPECVQGNAPHEPCGTGAQAWGVSELLRVLVALENVAKE